MSDKIILSKLTEAFIRGIQWSIYLHTSQGLHREVYSTNVTL